MSSYNLRTLMSASERASASQEFARKQNNVGGTPQQQTFNNPNPMNFNNPGSSFAFPRFGAGTGSSAINTGNTQFVEANTANLPNFGNFVFGAGEGSGKLGDSKSFIFPQFAPNEALSLSDLASVSNLTSASNVPPEVAFTPSNAPGQSLNFLQPSLDRAGPYTFVPNASTGSSSLFQQSSRARSSSNASEGKNGSLDDLSSVVHAERKASSSNRSGDFPSIATTTISSTTTTNTNTNTTKVGSSKKTAASKRGRTRNPTSKGKRATASSSRSRAQPSSSESTQGGIRDAIHGSEVSIKSRGGTGTSKGKAFLTVDLTPYLTEPQNQVAERLGMTPSTLSKRWKQAVPERKWPCRVVQRLDKKIITILHNVPKDQPLPERVKKELGVLVKKRRHELRPVTICLPKQ
eukprot:TRINITY_DN923_c0_g1_i1.p1 TRINITY_DN923_c0_g1~~TRINITY_DN923_c0_g1_i1.p1  ORF type:complete len:406 (+),score=76.00 TRINITY_DN923_c0_g1_i1:108-1325(+)